MKRSLWSRFGEGLSEGLRTSDASPAALVGHSWEVLDFNPALCALLNLPSPPLGRDFRDYVRSGDRLPENPAEWDRAPSRLMLRWNASSECLIDMRAVKCPEGVLFHGERVLLSRDEMVSRISELNEEYVNLTRELTKKNLALESARAEIKVLSGILPICSFCKKIRDGEGNWTVIEAYISTHSEAGFSHGLCPACISEHYPEFDY